MRLEVVIDDKLLADAREFSGIDDPSALIAEALTVLVQRKAAQRLIELGGSAPDLVAPRRRRFGSK